MIYNLINGFLYKISSSTLNLFKLLSKTSVYAIVPYNYQILGIFIIDETFNYLKPMNKSSIRIISIGITSTLFIIYIIYTNVKKKVVEKPIDILEIEDFEIINI